MRVRVVGTSGTETIPDLRPPQPASFHAANERLSRTARLLVELLREAQLLQRDVDGADGLDAVTTEIVRRRL